MTGDWRTWLMIGAVGFGGPAGQVAILHRELVERRRWLDEDEFLAALVWGVSFPMVVVAAGLIGCLLLPTPTPKATPESSVVSTPPVAGGAMRHLAVVGGVAAIVWAACLWGVTATHAAGDRGGAIARLFTTTTLLSLGGAYAVVPWALDESVARGWLDADERFTALAMGEATPGPLILVVTFIGFMAGWKGAPDAALPAGLAGASIATLFAFLPSFALIFGLAPFVRSIHAGSRLGRTMTGVGAAVVAAALVSGRASTPVVVLVAAAIGAAASLLR